MAQSIDVGTGPPRGHEDRMVAFAATSLETLWPKGRHVVVSARWRVPSITANGVSTANEIALNDPLDQLGAILRKHMTRKMIDGGDRRPRRELLGPSAVVARGLSADRPLRTVWAGLGSAG